MKTPQPECLKFAERLIEAMLDKGQHSQRKSATGVTTLELKKVADVTSEMARRYTLGLAWPENERMAKIARWLDVREAWLRYGELPKTNNGEIQESKSADIYVIDEPEAFLNPQRIALLQDCMTYVVDTKNLMGFSISERAVAKAAAGYFNHCIKRGITPSEISEDVRDAVLSAAAGADN